MCRVANHQTRLPRATSSLALNASLGNLFQCVSTLWVKNFLLISNLNLPCLSLKPFPPQELLNSYSCDILSLILVSQSYLQGPGAWGRSMETSAPGCWVLRRDRCCLFFSLPPLPAIGHSAGCCNCGCSNLV